MGRFRVISTVVCCVLLVTGASSQPNIRRVTTVAALHQYPGYFHLQSVLVHGELKEDNSRVTLFGGEQSIQVLLIGVSPKDGLAEVRGQLLDIGRMEPGDPRLGSLSNAYDVDRWPRPGEELVLNVTAVSEAQVPSPPTVRALALEPWRFDGQKVTVVGQFRGRNLFGDLPSAPGKSRYDFVLRSVDAAIWVTDLRPRGRGFDLSVDARVDTGSWLQVTGILSQDRGLVTLAGSAVTETSAPDATAVEEEVVTAPVPVEPAEVVFSSPTEGEIGVSPSSPIRVQFSRGLDPASLHDQFRASYEGGPSLGAAPAAIELDQSYDAATRAVELRFRQPLEPLSTVKIEVLDGIKAFDGAPVKPWTLTFTIGAQ